MNNSKLLWVKGLELKMNVKNLVEVLKQIEDKSKPVGIVIRGEFYPLDSLVGVLEWADVVELQAEIKIGG